MHEARHLVRAERCSVFLLEPGNNVLVAKIFDGLDSDDFMEFRIEAGIGILGRCAETGQIYNVTDVYSNPMFYKGVDEATGFKTKNILCFPIFDNDTIIGVAQMCNKTDGLEFDSCDEAIAKSFSVFCGVSIQQGVVYQNVSDARARQQLANELLTHHTRVADSAIDALVNNFQQVDIMQGWEDMQFAARPIPMEDTTSYVLKMFYSLGLTKRWNIADNTLACFTLLTQKGYRDTPYHNWTHAFCTAHAAFAFIFNLHLEQKHCLTEIEVLSLLVSCICHDLDHRGTNNSFQTQTDSVLASLYSSEGSVNEQHHLSQALCILNTPGCNILDNLSSKEYGECILLLRHNILATDLAQHLRMVKEIDAMASEGFDCHNVEHRKHLLSLLMTCCDLSDQTKSWDCVQKVSKLVYSEFFAQGDLERAMGRRPMEMMDREKACVPSLQMSFLEDIVVPTYKILCKIFPETSPLLERTKSNLLKWNKVSTKVK